MWYLKYKFKHSDCIYSQRLRELKLDVFFFHLGSYTKKGFVFTSTLQQIKGKDNNITKYSNYLRKHKQIVKIEKYDNILFTLAKHKSKIKIYESVYNPQLLFPVPAYLDKEGFEVVEIACWDRKVLQNLISSFEKNKTTTYFEILKFVNRDLDDIYVTRLLPKLAPKQHQAIALAYKNGYYQFPRKINLDKLSKLSKVSKATYRENLKKAEMKIMPFLISE